MSERFKKKEGDDDSGCHDKTDVRTEKHILPLASNTGESFLRSPFKCLTTVYSKL